MSGTGLNLRPVVSAVQQTMEQLDRTRQEVDELQRRRGDLESCRKFREQLLKVRTAQRLTHMQQLPKWGQGPQGSSRGFKGVPNSFLKVFELNVYFNISIFCPVGVCGLICVYDVLQNTSKSHWCKTQTAQVCLDPGSTSALLLVFRRCRT